jgi:hypothetical protein
LRVIHAGLPLGWRVPDPNHINSFMNFRWLRGLAWNILLVS